MALLCCRRHRFPPEIIQHAIWLYLRFTLSYRDVEELLAERGLDLSYEQADVSLAGGRSRGRGARHAGPAPARQPGPVAESPSPPQLLICTFEMCQLLAFPTG